MHPYVNTAIKAARAAGNVIMQGFARLDTISITSKGIKDFATNIDTQAEKIIIDTLLTAYPGQSIFAEESGHIGDNDYQWIIDPLDGTLNFIHGYPSFCVSIAFKYKNRLEHAVIYDPNQEIIFTASKGAGAQKNQLKMRVASVANISDAFLATSFPFKLTEYIDVYFDSVKEIARDCLSIRRGGSAALALAYVGSGQVDGFWSIGLSPWDMAAGALLVRESGGIVTDIFGSDDYLKTGTIIAANHKIHKALLRKLQPLAKHYAAIEKKLSVTAN